MKITLQSTGGFAGPAAPETISVDLAALPEPQRAALEQAVNRLAQGDPGARRPPAPGDFRHVLKLEEAGVTRTYSFHDADAGTGFAGLVAALRAVHDSGTS